MIGTKKYLFFLLLLPLLLGSCKKLTKLLAKKQTDPSYSNTSSTSPSPKVEAISTWKVETFINPKAIRKLSQPEVAEVSGFYDGFGFAIHPSEISGLDKLARIQQVITDVSEKEIVPLKLTRNIATKIYGEASPDSIVEVDDGSGRIVKVYADERGLWDARITQNDRLRERNGFA